MKTNWQTKKLDEVCDFFTDGNWIESKDQSSDGIRLIQTGNIGQGFFKDRGEKARYISEKTFKRLKCTEIFKGDILISRLPDPVGRACILPDTGEKMITAVDCSILRLNKNTSPNFLNYYTQSNSYLSEVEQKTTGTTRKRISRKNLGLVKVPLPPLPEQHRIVKILDEVFADVAKAKENAQKNLQNSKELFDNCLHSIFTNNSSGWEFKKLSEVAEYFNGLTYSPKDVSNKGIIVLRSSNIQNDDLDFSDIVRVDRPVKDKIIVQDGDILMCSRNGSKRLVGKTATINNLKEKMTFGTFMMIVRSNQNSYLKWFFKSSEFRRQITRGENTMINQITRYMLDDIVISFPQIEEQKSIVARLDALSAETRKLEMIYQQKLADFEELKKSVLKRAFNGDL